MPEIKTEVKTEKFSFRAECLFDVGRFIVAVVEKGVQGSLVDFRCNAVEHGEVVGEFKSTMSLEELRDALRELEDSHVMLQTLRQCPLAENSQERDYDLH